MTHISEKEGCLYVLYDGATGMCKIGMTKRAGERQRSIMGGHGTTLVNVLNARVPDRFAAETKCHRHFRAYRQNGEWFYVSPVEIVSYIHEHIDWYSLAFENLARICQYIAASRMHNQHAARLALS